ncbi:MAG: hypothetical protein IT578_07215 [Verrucomicrobiae bacterium]|nr:hypothetical protein [Verrucomicrobiae bacterium]
MTPEHLHLLLNHLPIAGSAFAALALLGGLIFRNAAVCRTGMALTVAATLLTPLVLESGEKARIGIVVATGAVPLDPSASSWIHEHEERAEVLAVVLYATLIAAAGALALSWKKPAWTLPLGGAMLLLCLACLGGGVWTAAAGGKIRHTELRPGVAPPHDD